MKTAWTIARRELRALFDHPMGYILLVVFLVVNDFLFFRTVYEANLATLRPMLQLMPWIFLIFVPAATMRAVAEDVRSGTLEVVLAQPVTELALLAGKFLGQLLFVWIAVALTLPVAFALGLGADLHLGVIVAQYVGAALLAATMVAIGVWGSSITPNQITAFITGVAVLFLLILVGVDPIVAGLPAAVSAAISSLSILRHFESIARGVIDLRDVIYFVGVAGVFLSLAYAAILRRKLPRGGEARRRLALGTSLLAATVVVVTLLGGRIGGRLDLTPGRAYTLSGASKVILRGLDDFITLKLFVSADLPPQFAVVERDISDLLQDMRAAARGNVRVLKLDPADDPEAETDARTLGIPPVQFNVIGESELQMKEGFLGIAVQYADGVETIPFVQRTEDLEYRLVSSIRALTRTSRPAIGFVEGSEAPQRPSFGRLRQTLAESYEVRTIAVQDTSPIADDVVALILADSPMLLSDSQAVRFREFMGRGGGVFVFSSSMQLDQQTLMASARPVGWNQLLEPYGVSILPTIVYDLASHERVAVPVPGGRVPVNYPFWLRALSTRASIVNENLDAVLLPWASSIDTTRARPRTVVPLLVTSRAAGAEMGRAFVNPSRNLQELAHDSLRVHLLGVIVDPQADEESEGPRGRAVVVGNTDFLTDAYLEFAPGGAALALNVVDWLAQEDALIRIRAKDRRPPPLVLEAGFTRDAAKWGNVVGVPLLLALYAAFRLWRRRARAGEPYRVAEAGGEA
jgi:ABC-type uncharacterized transport system involved in gliding motility auxiliary subunit/ABC-type transport system involved in multi-copper enzyme maturation permease subunit